MSHSDDTPESIDDQLEHDGGEPLAVSQDYKVLGYNQTGSGTTYGVLGRVDSPSGYGLYTPDDAKVDGITENGEDQGLG